MMGGNREFYSNTKSKRFTKEEIFEDNKFHQIRLEMSFAKKYLHMDVDGKREHEIKDCEPLATGKYKLTFLCNSETTFRIFTSAEMNYLQSPMFKFLVFIGCGNCYQQFRDHEIYTLKQLFAIEPAEMTGPMGIKVGTKQKIYEAINAEKE